MLPSLGKGAGSVEQRRLHRPSKIISQGRSPQKNPTPGSKLKRSLMKFKSTYATQF